jgi:hypothetical protein
MLTPEIVSRLDDPFKPLRSHSGWCDSYDGALPYWRQAYDTVMTEFFDDLPDLWRGKFRFALEEIQQTIFHLCEPDFRKRGDLEETPITIAKYSLERIISKMDNLRNRVVIRSRA